MSADASIWESIPRLNESVVLITVVAVRGSVPGELGSKLLAAKSGAIQGTVGGGKVEARAIETAKVILESNSTAQVELKVWNLQRDIGMTCGGEMTLLFEPILSKAAWHVAIFGAGHVATSLVGVLATLNCHIDLIDPRAEWLAKFQQYTNVTTHQPDAYEDCVADLIEQDSFVICVTKGHSTDRPVLREVFTRYPNIAFAGAIGSASKRAVLCRELREDNIAEQTIDRLVCPLGLPIGSNAPAEIAISISAQLIEYRDR